MIGDIVDSQRSPISQPQQQQRAFRESCQNCADSKVRCSKNKPTCARCARRGTPCVYQQSRRAGRKLTYVGQAKQARRAATNTLNDVSSSYTWEVDTGNNDLQLSPPRSDTTPNTTVSQMGPNDSQAVSENFSPLESFPNISGSTEWCSNEIFKALCIQSVPLMRRDDAEFALHISQDLTTLNDEFLNLDDSGRGPVPLDLGSEFLGLPLTWPGTAGDTHPTGYEAEDTSSSRPACNKSCTEVISRLFPELFCSFDSRCERSQPQGESLVNIIASNESMSEAMNSILECECSQDIHVLFVVGLCTSKVMSFYLKAMRRECLKDAQRAGDSYATNDHQRSALDVEGGDSKAEIMAAHMVLGGLHRIQQLLARLSDRLKQTEPEGDLANDYAGPGGLTGNELRNPFPASMLQQLEHSLRAHLRYVFACRVQKVMHGRDISLHI
ncbi:hypothetical protein COCSADRAFT_176763 [Bipolaris sorokiniana ND90Pr]|uniref:Zn(2)-C6 fungal-type domain-containing protein n=1 Tax=Cochliobolus sativus (strain ND90Pr / ATCC 201652) TaxID=665912 RepID=M2S7C4_COCSN|nr:uncharacterized protein COCSADRAFT_176763 [Bipolaris sorokiniana ND90Pr]EMD58280.1 hypothetical protein COCSADRAFT_176763 [Bipolaris sorokiniana ND90Pr]